MKMIVYNIYKIVSSRNKQKTSFKLTFRYLHVNDVLSLNNLSSIIILMLYIRRNLRLDTTDAPKWANYLEFDEDGKLFTRLYDKRDD